MKKDYSFPNSRRQFLQNSLKLSAMAPLASQFPLLDHSNEADSALIKNNSHQLKILILGGTSFLGPHQIAYALKRGHSISTFTRGKTKPTVHQKLFKEVEHLVGDRNDNLEALKGRKWDAVIDNSGRKVEWTKASAELLKENVGLYLYTSSTGVYYPYLGEDIKEDTKLVTEMPDNLNEEEELEYGYGVMKTNSENTAKSIFGSDRIIIVRPTYMMGPADRTDRFTYWPVRLERGGEVLVPGKPDDPVQYIDVRDVAEFMIRLIEHKQTGTYNAVGPASAQTMMPFIYGAHAAFSSPVSFVEVPDYDFLIKHKIYYSVPWIMPTGKNIGSAKINFEASLEKGMSFRPLAESIRDIFEWWNSGVVSKERIDKMTSAPDTLMAREAEILKAWKNR